MAENKLLSIIITSYTADRLQDVCELLDSIKAQTYPRTETVFVAEKSRELLDGVKLYAENNAIHGVRVLFNEGEPGASAARNLGIRNSTGEIIAFVDDDAVLDPAWAENMIKTLQDDDIVAVTGLSEPQWQCQPADWLPDEFHWIISCTSFINCPGLMDVRNIWLQNASFRREAFEQAGYISLNLGPRDSVDGFKSREFQDGIISEEIELSLRIKEATGKRIVCNPDIRIKHKVYPSRLKFSYLVKWSYWTGYAKHKTKQIYSGTDVANLGTEYSLLGRIITRLLPKTLLQIFTRPFLALRRLFTSGIILLFVALGYGAHWARSIGEKPQSV